MRRKRKPTPPEVPDVKPGDRVYHRDNPLLQGVVEADSPTMQEWAEHEQERREDNGWSEDDHTGYPLYQAFTEEQQQQLQNGELLLVRWWREPGNPQAGWTHALQDESEVFGSGEHPGPPSREEGDCSASCSFIGWCDNACG